MYYFIFRDVLGQLFASTYMPHNSTDGLSWEVKHGDILKLNDGLYPEVTFQNSPMEINFKTKNIREIEY